jgi:hypothetical protein
MPLFDRGGRSAANPGNATALRSQSPHATKAPAHLAFLGWGDRNGDSVTLRLLALLVSMLDRASYKDLECVLVLLWCSSEDSSPSSARKWLGAGKGPQFRT